MHGGLSLRWKRTHQRQPTGHRGGPAVRRRHWALGLSGFYLGEIEPTRAHFERAIAISDVERISPLVSFYGSVISRGHLARTLLYLGFADQSQQMIDQAIERTQGMRHPVGLADALALTAHLLAFHRHAQPVQETAAAIACMLKSTGCHTTLPSRR